ncbi:MAG: FAD-dependent monooxygenase [Actinomycetes bacterium]
MIAAPVQPVAIIGAGPVGQSAALLLARWGIPSVLLDQRAARDRVGSRSICQQREVLDIWAAVGAGQQIATEGVTWRTARTYYRDRELFSLTLADPGRSPFPPFVNISQSRTEEVLDARIAAEPLIEPRWSHRVVGIESDPDEVTLRCATPAGRVAIRAPYAVACAGAHGDLVRSELGVDFAGDSFTDRFLICDIAAELPGWERERRFYFDPAWNPGRQVLIHPCPDSTYRIDWQVPPDFDLAAEERSGGLDRRIRAILGDVAYRLLWRTDYRFHARCVDRMRVGRVLLAGDCAHLVAPFGARGLNSGVQDAENAAWKLAFVLREWAPSRLLDSYHTERHAAAVENLDVTSTTMRFLVPPTEADWAHRVDVLERALSDPAVVREVDSGRLAEPFWYPDSPLTTPDPSRPVPARPPRGAIPPVAPGVLVPDLPLRSGHPDGARLRELVRDGLLVLTANRAPDPDLTAGWARSVTAAPIRAYPMGALSAELEPLLGARPGEAWLIRPDGHLAAVVEAGDQRLLAMAIRRCLALPAPD